jgi:hypothetical protein
MKTLLAGIAATIGIGQKQSNFSPRQIVGLSEKELDKVSGGGQITVTKQFDKSSPLVFQETRIVP